MKSRNFLRKAKKTYKQACKNRYHERNRKRAYYWKYYRVGSRATHHLDIFEKLLEDTKIPQLFKYEWQRKLFDYANSRQYADFAKKKED